MFSLKNFQKESAVVSKQLPNELVLKKHMGLHKSNYLHQRIHKTRFLVNFSYTVTFYKVNFGTLI